MCYLYTIWVAGALTMKSLIKHNSNPNTCVCLIRLCRSSLPWSTRRWRLVARSLSYRQYFCVHVFLFRAGTEFPKGAVRVIWSATRTKGVGLRRELTGTEEGLYSKNWKEHFENFKCVWYLSDVAVCFLVPRKTRALFISLARDLEAPQRQEGCAC
jgi:hypothetical protein